jgi:hypothetical protein
VKRSLTIAWSLLGVLAVLADAILRLSPIALQALGSGLAATEWIFLAGWTAGMAFFEGYQGFHRRFAPVVVARAWHLAEHPRGWHVALAPLFCMGFFHGSRARLARSWLLTLGIVALVLGIRAMPQPWRGLIDAGVVVGLSWGSVSILVHAVRASRGQLVDPQLPS